MGLAAVWYWPFTMGFRMHISLAAMLFSKTALPWSRIQAYSGLETEISISGSACMSLYTSFWLLVQNQSLPSSSPANIKGRHLALPSRPTVARYCTGLAFRMQRLCS